MHQLRRTLNFDLSSFDSLFSIKKKEKTNLDKEDGPAAVKANAKVGQNDCVMSMYISISC